MDVKKYEPAMEQRENSEGKHVIAAIIGTLGEGYYLESLPRSATCEQYNLTVDLEYVPIASVKTLAGTVDVLRTVNRSNAGLMVDVHHFHRAQDDVAELAKLPAEWFHFGHLCDAPGEIPAEKDEMTRILREERSYVGEGGIDVASIMNAMPPMPYSIELPNLKKVAEYGYKEHARRCLIPRAVAGRVTAVKHKEKIPSGPEGIFSYPICWEISRHIRWISGMRDRAVSSVKRDAGPAREKEKRTSPFLLNMGTAMERMPSSRSPQLMA